VALLQSTLEPARRLWSEAPADFKVDGNPAASLWVETNLTLGYIMLKAEAADNRLEELQQALAQLRRTAEMAEQVRAAHPGVPDLTAKCNQYVGYALEGLTESTGDPKYLQEAAVVHRRSADSACRISRKYPSPQTLRNCADSLGGVSWALHNIGEGQPAVQAAREALAIMEPISNAEPNSAEAQQDLAIAYFHLGAAENVAGRFQEAIGDLRAAESRDQASRQIQRGDPLEALKLHIDIHRELAKSLVAVHDAASAVKILQQTIEAAEKSATVRPRELLNLRRQFEQARASQAATRLPQLAGR
jgi:tetratricopeptide (TPR) repeat protein